MSVDRSTHHAAGGVSTLSGIADELNRRGILTATGKGKWLPSMVWRLLERAM